MDTPHTLDLIISTDDCLSEIEHLSPLGLSDHSVLKFSYQFYKDTVKTEDNFKLDNFKLDKGDYVKLRAFLDINWDEVLDVSNNTIDEMWERFKQIILEGMNNFIPRGSKRLNKKKNYQPFTSGLKQLIHKKKQIASSVLSSMGLSKEGLQCFSYYIWLINGQNV